MIDREIGDGFLKNSSLTPIEGLPRQRKYRDRAKQEGTEQGRTEYSGLNLIGCLLKKKPEEDTRNEIPNGKTIEKS